MARVTAYATGGGEPKDLFFAPIDAVDIDEAAERRLLHHGRGAARSPRARRPE
mgnify:CR=1 FL=1